MGTHLLACIVTTIKQENSPVVAHRDCRQFTNAHNRLLPFRYLLPHLWGNHFTYRNTYQVNGEYDIDYVARGVVM